MIHIFKDKFKILLFPTSWANSVANWISGLHSQSGTIKIANTLNPGESKSASLDVNIPALVEKISPEILNTFERNNSIFKPDERTIVIDNNGCLSVNRDWIARCITANTVVEP